MEEIRVKKGNYGFYWVFTIEEDGQEKDLTGLTPYLKVWNSSGELVKQKPCSVVDNKVKCLIEQGDFDTAGVYYGEIELQRDAYVEDTESFIIRVLTSF